MLYYTSVGGRGPSLYVRFSCLFGGRSPSLYVRFCCLVRGRGPLRLRLRGPLRIRWRCAGSFTFAFLGFAGVLSHFVAPS